MNYDPFSAEVLADPFPAYARLREKCPVHFHADFTPPFFTLSRSDDVRTALSDAERFSIRYGQSPQYTRASGLMNDPPEHTPFRRLFNRAFTPNVVARLERGMEGLATQLLDAMLPDGSADFQKAYASPFPTMIIAELLGIPPRDHRLFRQMSDELTATFNAPDPAVSGPPRKAFDDYFLGVIERRRAQHPEERDDDLISRFVGAELEGERMSNSDLQMTLLLLLLGGNETSTALLTNLLWRLLERPERWQAVRDDPRLVDIAVEESLRRDPPVLGLFRTNPEAMTLHGVDIPECSKIMLLYGAVNHDPEIFEDPGDYRLDRDPDYVRRHTMTFGFGHHFCPGAHLARLEGRMTLRLLLERAPELRLVGEPERIVPFNLWGRANLPVAW